MKSRGAWLVRLAMAGCCLAWVGCGGSDVPDPDGDSAAAQEAPPKLALAKRGVEESEPPGDDTAKTDAPPKPENSSGSEGPTKPQAPSAASNPAAPPDQPAKPDPAAPATEGDKNAPAIKGDASGTDDLLRMAGTPPPGAAPGATPAPASPATPAPGAAAATPPPGPGSEREDSSRGRPAATAPAPSPSSAPPLGGPMIPPPAATGSFSSGNPSGNGTPPPGAPGGGGRQAGGAMDREEGMPGGGGAGFAGGMGMPGGPGGGGAIAGPAAFLHPTTAVTAFLAAVQSKNKERLAQTTAIRSATEAEEKHRKIFAAIVEQSISDEELDEMVRSLGSYKVAYQLPAKSTGRIGVVIAKMSGRDTFQRTVTVRKEKEGWKVMDISDALDFQPNRTPIGGMGRRRR